MNNYLKLNVNLNYVYIVQIAYEDNCGYCFICCCAALCCFCGALHQLSSISTVSHIRNWLMGN